MGELLWLTRDVFTAHELYGYYVNCRRVVLTKPHAHTNPDRRRQVVAHWRSTGHWGMGNVNVGDLVT